MAVYEFECVRCGKTYDVSIRDKFLSADVLRSMQPAKCSDCGGKMEWNPYPHNTFILKGKNWERKEGY